MRTVIALLIFVFSIFVFSCKNDVENKTAINYDSLISSNKKLNLLMMEKDSLISSFIESYTDIQLSLSSIRNYQKFVGSNSVAEVRNTNKKMIIENINKIDGLLKKNKATISTLKDKLKSTDAKSGDKYNNLITALEKITHENENDIPAITNSLDSIDLEIQHLTKKYDEALTEAAQKNKLLNTAYYTAGTEKELIKKGVISKQGGFIGLGKTQKLSERFNKDNFVKVDISKLKTIKLSAKTIKLVTTHPQNSYNVKQVDDLCIISVTNSTEFWAASKYMVVIIEK